MADNPTTGEEKDAYDRWIGQLAGDAQSRRRARLDTLASADQVLAWAADLRRWFRTGVGPLLPLAGPQKREHVGTIAGDGYSIQKWLFESLPGTWTSANLYVPAAINAAGVAVCAPVGHWPEGKARLDYQRMASFFAVHGIPVLVYDHAGLGERREYVNRITGLSPLGRSPTCEHSHTGALATLAGIAPSRFYITEAARAFEFLASFDFVNEAKIGFTGASGGGTICIMAGAYIDEAVFNIPVCIVRGETIGGTGDAEQQIPGAGVRGVASVDLLATLAPKPTMIVTETNFDASARSYATLRRLYDIAGAPSDATEFFAVADVHGYTRPMIEAAYAFLAKNFGLPAIQAAAWGRVVDLAEPQTWCSPSGLLVRDRPQITLQEQIALLAPQPAGLMRTRLAELLGIADWTRSPVPYAVTGEAAATVVVTGAVTTRPGELGLMAWPEKPAELCGFGQAALYSWREAGEARRLPEFGRSLIGLRVRQILDFLEDHSGVAIELVGEREWSVPVALACALAPAGLLPRALARYLPACFRDHLHAALNTTPLSTYVPGLLTAGDLNDVVALCDDRLAVEHRVDADGRVIQAAPFCGETIESSPR